MIFEAQAHWRLVRAVRTILPIGVKTAAIFAVVMSSAATAPADTGTFTVLHAFTNSPDGAEPAVGVSVDPAGNIYGSTIGGGDAACLCGTVFEITPGGTESVLLAFDGSNGSNPYSAPLIDKSGNLYGTTYAGGAGLNGGQGTIFKIAADGTASVLYSFCTADGCPDGGNPVASLIADKNGNLYGVGQEGGANGSGVVFEFTAGGSLKVVYSFDYASSGAAPDSTLIRDAAGNFYGTACCGGAAGQGTVFKLTPKGKETTLYSFTDSNGDGGLPSFGGLIMDSAGDLFGTTQSGGKYGWGTVFELAADGTETVLYSFKNTGDGALPAAPLVLDRNGNLYGTAGGSGVATLFKVKPTGKESVLHTFAASDGSDPAGGLLFHKGTFYGTALAGGNGGGCGRIDCGTVFAYVK